MIFCWVLLLTLPANAQTPEIEEPPPPPVNSQTFNLKEPESFETEDIVAKVFIYLALFGGCAVAILFMVRKNRWGIKANKKGSLLKIEETHMLGNKQFLVVAEFANQKILLGVGPGMIKNLACSVPPSYPQKSPLEKEEA